MDDSVIGTEVEGYRIEEVLGKGGMGVVYKAEDVALSRDVALKRIDPSLANDEAFLRRFRSEAKALARIDSPYIVSVHALRQTEIGLLLVMEYVKGGTLKDLTEEGPMEWSEALPIVKQMLTALEHAHGAEVIHRDIKPQNIMLSAEGTVKVTDFGLAKVHRPDSNKTVTQGVFGTLNYMSPEQVKGATDLDHRSDLYSLGMTIYEMVVGDLPFDDDSSEFEKMQKIVDEDPPPPAQVRSQVPDEASALVMKALEKNPDERFQSAKEMREALEATEEKQQELPPTEPPPEPSPAEKSESDGSSRWKITASVSVVALLLAGVSLWLVAGARENAEPAPTQISVSTDPHGAAIFLNRERIGTAPIIDTIRGKTAEIRAQLAGYGTLDTTITQLNGKSEVTLDLPLSRTPTPLSVEADPGGQVLLDGRKVGETPFAQTLKRDSVRVQVKREGFSPVDTIVSLAQTQQAQLRFQLNRKSPPEPPPEEQESDSEESSPDPEPEDTAPAYGSLTLNASPTGSLTIDNEGHPLGRSIQVTAGENHQIRIEHPQYGACDTTLTVQEETSRTLTCYFEHRVAVRTRGGPWANVLIGGESTGQSTPHDTLLTTGKSYRIDARIQSRPFKVTGGKYLRLWTENGTDKVRGPEQFRGHSTSVTLRPGFVQKTHVIDFETKSEQ